MNIQEQVPLAPLTTMQVGGPARYFAEAQTTAEVREVVEFARERGLPLFVLGGGSNLVVADAGFNGVVLKVCLRGIDERHEGATALFDVGAGEEWDTFVGHAVGRNCSGVECLSGIPGTVGGTPVQNVGAYGQEVAETIFSVRAFDLESGRECEFTKAECGFAYRTSRFNTSERGKYVILGVTFALTQDGSPRLAYSDLKKHFAERNTTPTLAEVRETVLRVRGSKGMVLAKGDNDCRSAGSFFKNPVLAEAELQKLQGRAAEYGLTIPSYPALAARHKVSAAWLIENAGFPKGYSRGAAGISTKHTLAIVNKGGASAAQIIALKNEIQRDVAEKFGIALRPEPVFLGFEEGM